MRTDEINYKTNLMVQLSRSLTLTRTNRVKALRPLHSLEFMTLATARWRQSLSDVYAIAPTDAHERQTGNPSHWIRASAMRGKNKTEKPI